MDSGLGNLRTGQLCFKSGWVDQTGFRKYESLSFFSITFQPRHPLMFHGIALCWWKNGTWWEWAICPRWFIQLLTQKHRAGGTYRNQWSHLGRSLLPAGPPPISRCLGGEHRVGLSSGTAQEGPELWKKTQTWSSAVWIVEAATSCGSEFVAPICWACFSISTVRRLDCIISGSFHGMGSFNRYLMSIYRDHVCLTHLYMPCPWNSSWCIL